MSQKGSHCAHLNIRSLSNKHDLLRHTILKCNNNLHVLGLSETWLTPQCPDALIDIEDYVCIRSDRNWSSLVKPGQTKKGGGVCLYLNDQLNILTTSFGNFNRNCNDIEIQWVETINKNNKNMLIANCYRPPDGNVASFLEYLENSLGLLDLTKYDLLLMGDFNIDYLDKNSENTRKLKSCIKQFGIDQLINKPTRYSTLRDSCLDLICTNTDHIANSCVCNVNISDHEMVLVTKKKVQIEYKYKQCPDM